MKRKLLDLYSDAFDRTDWTASECRLFFAPGRVNLIGEHIDYNGGSVLPATLSLGTYVLVVPRKDRQVRLYSGNFEGKGIIEFSLDELIYEKKDDWANYPKGVLSVFADKGHKGTAGFDAVFYGNIPNGAGLSSSASIEVVTAVMWNELNGFGVDPVTLVQWCQQAENDFIGVNCGIMDQFSIGLGKKDHAILLDCDSLSYEYTPLELGEYVLVVANTNKRRGLADSKYNERRSECERAMQALQMELRINELCELTPESFEEHADLIEEQVVRKRAKHAVTEHARTLQAAKRLKAGELKQFGLLMNDSHVSLRDDYEVTGKELDALVSAAWEEESVIGARMTGAGFGGCTVNLIHRDNLDQVLSRIGEKYKQVTGLNAVFYVADSGEGAHEITGE
ncbi:galactokinase [Alteribacter lacisalsi]|uniref:Galactokinase n=1 Tax=Alteribacter lacisalsi TaxID=2045244 RepID=A0A2W0HQI4_9BACI|nr:galactokinase [Alteribacter lacisalsi]PYZ99139.1 galactokinase [Alteribacter lacisalsi]